MPDINAKPDVNAKYVQIWQTVQLIPKGKVVTYGQIADLAGLPGRARLVGKALRNTPQLGWQEQLIPWHRVINSQGKISFPVGNIHFQRQKQYLQEEQVVVVGSKVRLKDFQWQPDLTDILHRLLF